MSTVRPRPCFWKLAAAAIGLIAAVTQAQVIDDFDGTELDTATWQYFRDVGNFTVANGLLNWSPQGAGSWDASEILSNERYLIPPAGQTSVVTWIIGPAMVTQDSVNGDVSARVQLGLVSANEGNTFTREMYQNVTGGVWLDLPSYASTTPTELNVQIFTANDTKPINQNATMPGEYLLSPYNWQTEGRTLRIELTHDGFRCLDDSALMYEGTWAEAGIDTEFDNGFQLFAMGMNYDDGRGNTSLDRVEYDNPVLPGLIISFAANPVNGTSGGNTTLSFEVDPAATVTIEPGIGTVPHTDGIGSTVVGLPEVETSTPLVYTLTATSGAEVETRELTVTVHPVPILPLADFVDEFEGDAVDGTLWRDHGNRTRVVTGGQLEIQDDGDNWGHGTVSTVGDVSYRIPGPGESTVIDFVIGPVTITTDIGASARYQMGIFSANQDPGTWSFEHWQNNTGGVWLDLDSIANIDPTAVYGHINHADDTKEANSNAPQLAGVSLTGWNWQTENRAVTLELTEFGYTWYDGTTVLGGTNWVSFGIDTEFLNGYKIVATAIHMDTGRATSHYESISAASITDQFPITAIVKGEDAVEVSWETQDDGSTYAVRRVDALDGDWTELDGDLPASTTSYTDSPLMDQAFYQIVKSPPPALLDSGGFEEGADLSGWQEVDYYPTEPSPSVWAAGEPTDPPSAYRGSRVAGTVLGGDYPSEYVDQAYQTPVIDLTNVTEATLTFVHWFSLAEGTDFGEILVVDPDDPFTVLAEIHPGFGYTGQSGGWLPAQIPMPEEAIGNRVRLLFYFNSFINQSDRGWYLDDVIVR